MFRSSFAGVQNGGEGARKNEKSSQPEEVVDMHVDRTEKEEFLARVILWAN